MVVVGAIGVVIFTAVFSTQASGTSTGAEFVEGLHAAYWFGAAVAAAGILKRGPHPHLGRADDGVMVVGSKAASRSQDPVETGRVDADPAFSGHDRKDAAAHPFACLPCRRSWVRIPSAALK